MTPELQKYYESRFDMMSTEGWSDLTLQAGHTKTGNRHPTLVVQKEN
jgi:hypothetical protein